MRQDVKEAWTKALLSDEYRQGKFQLYDYDLASYCCLGVLCDVVEKRFPDISFGNDKWRDRKGLPWDLKCNLNMIDDASGMHISYLMEMNDSLGYDFQRIATYIEENL